MRRSPDLPLLLVCLFIAVAATQVAAGSNRTFHYPQNRRNTMQSYAVDVDVSPAEERKIQLRLFREVSKLGRFLDALRGLAAAEGEEKMEFQK